LTLPRSEDHPFCGNDEELGLLGPTCETRVLMALEICITQVRVSLKPDISGYTPKSVTWRKSGYGWLGIGLSVIFLASLWFCNLLISAFDRCKFHSWEQRSLLLLFVAV
jgi:hypothetical protein